MVISEHNIYVGFMILNRQYFKYELPTPKFKVSRRYRTIGEFSYKSVDGMMTKPCITMSGEYDYTSRQFDDILMHEMIHYYLAYTGEDLKCKHGKPFKRMAEMFNKNHGFNITSIIDVSGYKIKEGNSQFFFRLCTFF